METTSNDVKRITDRVYLVGADAGVVVNFSKGSEDASFAPSPNIVGWTATVDKGKDTKKPILFQPQGLKNDMPQARERLVTDNNVVATLIETKRDIHCGLGLKSVKSVLVDGVLKQTEVEMPTAAKDFFEANNFDGFLRDAFGEIGVHGGFLPECVRDKGGNIIEVEVKKARHMRSGMKDDNGNVAAWYW